jgi:hypothetical protein
MFTFVEQDKSFTGEAPLGFYGVFLAGLSVQVVALVIEACLFFVFCMTFFVVSIEI